MIERSASLDVFEERVCELYPQQPLSLMGIKLCRQDKGKQLLLLIGYDSLAELIQLVGKSTVIVQPRINLPLPSTALTPTVSTLILYQSKCVLSSIYCPSLYGCATDHSCNVLLRMYVHLQSHACAPCMRSCAYCLLDVHVCIDISVSGWGYWGIMNFYKFFMHLPNLKRNESHTRVFLTSFRALINKG